MLYVPIGTVWRWSQLALAIAIMLIEYICRGVLVTMYNLIPNFGIFARIPNPLSFSTSPLSDEELDFERTTSEMVRARGYPCEEHFTTTADGFILGMHRVPRGRVAMDGATPLENHTSSTTSSSTRPAVLILHGFMQCSETWVCRRDPQNSLPLFLADAGCDVWLGNNRGNKYSHKHLRYNPNQEEFWDFSLDDVVRYDVPAMIDYVLAKNGGRNLILIGFSQGTAQLWASLSSNPVLSPKVSLFIALAPVSTVKGFSNPLIDSIARTRPDFITLLFGRRAFLPLTLFWRKVLPRDKFVEVIDYSCKFLFGWNTACIDPTEKKILYSHIYSFSSVKAVVHWFQIIQTGRFQMFDQSLLIHTPRNVNWANNPPTHYHTHVMPAYQPSLITCPVALYYGGNDNLPNTEALLRSLPKNLVMEVHREPEYEHLDFMWASDVGEKIYPKILKVIDDSRKVKFS